VRSAAAAGAAEGAGADLSDGFFSGAILTELDIADFPFACVPVLVDCAPGLDCEAGDAEAEAVVEDESGRRLRIFGTAKMARMTRTAATKGTT
jgi:hypothetical protein